MRSITNKTHILLLLLASFCAHAQETVVDTTKTTQLEEVVVTGQIEPSSLQKSIFNVRVITKQDIQRQAAVNLGEMLNQYLNITVMPNSANGRSTVSMFGLDGQYFKILVDNVPLVNDSGFGNNTDLTQINLDDVERIEIIEGSMGVTHGANAVSGILNIITKKNSRYKWEATASVQEETVGKEYAWFDKGRHIQSLKISNKITENWFASVGANRTHFAGYMGNKEGKDYTINDGNRGYNWLPEEQYVTNAMVSYQKGNFRVFYKFDFLNEIINYYDYAVQTAFVPPATVLKYSNDERYITQRFYHHLNASGKFLSRINYNVSLSHQKQARDLEKFQYQIVQDNEANKSSVTDQSMEVLYSTGTFSNFLTNKTVNLQLGYELVNNNGFSLVSGENGFKIPVRKRLENYDAFLSGEISLTDKFMVRPGVRYSFQSRFDDQYATSLGLRYILINGYEARASAGRSYRTPNFEELYSRMIFSSHYFIGNETLIPETSMSYEASLKKQVYFESGAQLSANIIASFINIKDKIDMAFTGLQETTNTPMYQYINISDYNMWNVSSSWQYTQGNWNARLGASVIGISQEINNGVMTSDDKYLYSLQLNANVSYSVPKWNTLFSVFYKYNGKQQRFYEGYDDDGNASYRLSTLDAYSWMDASVKKSFFKNKLDVTLGGRNLLNLENVQQTQDTAGQAHATSTDILLGYGRSYYLKLAYNLNF